MSSDRLLRRPGCSLRIALLRQSRRSSQESCLRRSAYLLLRTSALLLMMAAVSSAPSPASQKSADPSGPPKPDLTAILARMAEHNSMRDHTLHNYACDRTYQVDNKRVNKSASVNVTMFFVEPDEKLFEVKSAAGMGFMRKGVLNRLIETERENSRGAQKSLTAITPANYAFTYLRGETVKGRLQHVLSAKALRKDKLLFNGTIWVDAEDGSVSRIEGQPAKRPSFWTRKVEFVQEYEKHGPYWFPVRNTSVTQVFIFGRTTTDIRHSNYRVNQPDIPALAAEVRKRGDKLEVQIDAKDREQSAKPR